MKEEAIALIETPLGKSKKDKKTKKVFFDLGKGSKKNGFFLGNSPKQRTPPTHPYGLGLT